jgi:DNA ligase-1
MTFKAMLASDFDENKIKFPCFLQPKIDGVRAINLNGGLTGRSLKKHKNLHATAFFSHPMFLGFDGEMVAAEATHPNLCSLTSSALGTIKGEPALTWWLFDYITPDTAHLPYSSRYEILVDRVAILQSMPESRELAGSLRVVPSHWCHTFLSVEDLDAQWLDEGYEGSIIRDPHGAYKQGRSTVKEGGLLRIKRFIDFEFEVLELIEGQTNENEAQTNELGRTFRSTHQENMSPNGMVGAMMGRILGDVVVKESGADKILFPKDSVVKVSAGSMPHYDRVNYFRNPDQIVGKIAKGKTFPKGVKDKPRFPTFLSLRSAEDMS